MAPATVAELMVTLGLDATAWAKGLSNATNQAQQFSGKIGGIFNNAVGVGLGGVFAGGIMAATSALGDGIKSSIKMASDLETSLSVLKQTSGATAAQMAQVSDVAKRMGNDLSLPGISAKNATEAMLDLARAGMTVDESMAAVKGTLQLAVAAQTDTSTAAQVVAGALNAFKLPAKDAIAVADLLAGAANASSASMTDLSQGLQQGAFAFSAGGQRIEDLAASLAILTNVGLTGSDAGTALKNALMRLMAPTETASNLMKDMGFNAFDAHGNMKPLRIIIKELNASMAKMTQQERNAALSTIFLSDGMKSMIPLLDQGVTGFDKMVKAVSSTGQAAELAKAQSAGLAGAWDAFQSTLETIGTGMLMPFLPMLTEGLNALSAALGTVPFEAWAKQAADAFGVIGKEIKWVFELFQDDPTMLIEYFGGIAEQGAKAFMRLREQVAQTLVNAIPSIMKALDEWLPLIGNALANAFHWAIKEIPDHIMRLAKIVEKGATPIGDAAKTWLEAMSQSLQANSVMVWSAIKEITPKALRALSDAIPGIASAARSWMWSMADSIRANTPAVMAALMRLLQEVGSFLVANAPAAFDALGKAAVEWMRIQFVELPAILAGIAGDAATAFINEFMKVWKQAYSPGALGQSIIASIGDEWNKTPLGAVIPAKTTSATLPKPVLTPTPAPAPKQQTAPAPITINVNNPLVDSRERIVDMTKQLNRELDAAILSGNRRR